jgi:type IV pilus assembly protein PilN
MIRINLLPYRAARKKENIRRQISIFLLLLIFTTLALCYYNLLLSQRVKDLDANVARTKTELNQYKQAIKEIDQIKRKLAMLNKKMGIIKGLDQRRKEPILLLDAMTRLVVDKKMWLTKLESKDNIVKLSGVALDNRTVADFMTRLEHSSLFSTVNLNMLRQSPPIQGVILKDFEITCTKSSGAHLAQAKATKP